MVLVLVQLAQVEFVGDGFENLDALELFYQLLVQFVGVRHGAAVPLCKLDEIFNRVLCWVSHRRQEVKFYRTLVILIISN